MPDEPEPQRPEPTPDGLLEGDVEVSMGDDGKVVIHAKCRPGEDPAKCAERVRFLVEALGQEARLEVDERNPDESS